MKTIIAGSRGIDDYRIIEAAVAASGFAITEVVSGAARGVDSLGERWAAEHGIPVRRFPADWSAHGRAGGPIRNREMAKYAEALIAVWDGGSRGTANMIAEAKAVRLLYMSTVSCKRRGEIRAYSRRDGRTVGAVVSRCPTRVRSLRYGFHQAHMALEECPSRPLW